MRAGGCQRVVVLDTNIVIALHEGDDAVLSNLDQASEVFNPAIVVGELFFGAAKSGRSSPSGSWPTDPFSRAISMLLVSMGG
jgi:predicted nucleic acid-binding protein